MIVVDTSALIAILRSESQAADCLGTIEKHGEVAISAGTLTEAMIVAGRHGFASEMTDLIDALVDHIIDLDEDLARKSAAACDMWGKGNHPAGLNFGDCFAYALAKTLDCQLLFVGNDFSRTDIMSAQ